MNHINSKLSGSLGECSTGSMNLVGPNGSNRVMGRVEYCSNGVWGTVNSDGFDVRDAHVACRRLGYQTPRMISNSLFMTTNIYSFLNRCFDFCQFIFWSRIWSCNV